mmetsp:Transcript_166/g.631  ORF Transcript_166/g.631 Transcript_166/m.631 type:complete len:287 (-) Transcript_166:124-984(-)
MQRRRRRFAGFGAGGDGCSRSHGGPFSASQNAQRPRRRFKERRRLPRRLRRDGPLRARQDARLRRRRQSQGRALRRLGRHLAGRLGADGAAGGGGARWGGGVVGLQLFHCGDGQRRPHDRFSDFPPPLHARPRLRGREQGGPRGLERRAGRRLWRQRRPESAPFGLPRRFNSRQSSEDPKRLLALLHRARSLEPALWGVKGCDARVAAFRQGQDASVGHLFRTYCPICRQHRRRGQRHANRRHGWREEGDACSRPRRFRKRGRHRHRGLCDPTRSKPNRTGDPLAL